MATGTNAGAGRGWPGGRGPGRRRLGALLGVGLPHLDHAVHALPVADLRQVLRRPLPYAGYLGAFRWLAADDLDLRVLLLEELPGPAHGAAGPLERAAARHGEGAGAVERVRLAAAIQVESHRLCAGGRPAVRRLPLVAAHREVGHFRQFVHARIRLPLQELVEEAMGRVFGRVMTQLAELVSQAPKNKAARQAALSRRTGEGWLGVEWDGRFLAYDGPYESLPLIEEAIFEQSMADALQRSGRFSVYMGGPDKLSRHAEQGYRIVYLTDRTSWRRKIAKGDALLLAKRTS